MADTPSPFDKLVSVVSEIMADVYVGRKEGKWTRWKVSVSSNVDVKKSCTGF
jgi:hypothetical protein